MRNTFFSLLAAATLFSGAAQAAESSAAAQTRAALYQREVQVALARHGWNITRNEPGKLTAERMWIQSGPTGIIGGVDTFARLLIDFRADGEHRPMAAARASLLVEPSQASETNKLAYPPLALRDPKLTQEYLEILAEAETQFGAGHPAHAVANTHAPTAVGSSARIAMK